MTKTLTFAVMHFTVAFVVAWLLTGDLLVGGLVAVAEPAINTVAYHFHEKIWRRVQRRQNADSPGPRLFHPFGEKLATRTL